jgi:hypothetical protein
MGKPEVWANSPSVSATISLPLSIYRPPEQAIN